MIQVPGPQASSDSLRAVLDTVFSRREYQWAERPALLGWLADAWNWLTETLRRFQQANPDLFLWFQIALLAILAGIVLHAGWVMLRTARAARQFALRAEAPSVAAPRTAGWFRDRAADLAGDGRFSEALLAAFQALVLDLDHREMLRFHPSKTPGEYAAESAMADLDRERFRSLVSQLYRYVFGHQHCGESEYRRWVESAGEGWHAAQG